MLRSEAIESAGVMTLDGYPGLVLKMPARITVENSAAVRAAILDAWQTRGNPPSLVLDMSDTHQIDSSGVGVLLEMSRKAVVDGIPVTLCGLRAAPRRVLSRTGVLERFMQCGSLRDAMPVGMADAAAARTVPPPPPKRRSHFLLWTFDAILAIAILCAAVYLFWRLGENQGQINRLSPVQRLTAGINQRLNAAEDAWRNWGHEKDAVLQHSQQVEDQTRRESQNMNAATEQRMRDELSRQNGELQNRISELTSEQQALNQRIDSLQQQLGPTTVPASGTADRMQLPGSNPANPAPEQRRIDFQVGLNHRRDLAPGVGLIVSTTDAAHQRFDGRLLLTPDTRSIAVRGQGVQQPVVFYGAADSRPRELVITHVTQAAASGYLLLPRENGASGGSAGQPKGPAAPNSK